MGSEENVDGSKWYVNQNEFSDQQYSVLVENQILEGISHLIDSPSDSDLVNVVPKVPKLVSGFFSEMLNSSGNSRSNCTQNNGFEIHRALRNAPGSLEHRQKSENGELETCFDGKRKRNVSSGVLFKNAEEQKQKDPFRDTETAKEHSELDRKMGGQQCTNLIGVNKAMDSVIGAEPGKENYLHMRAKRGQATSSHSLAERVRRERISERMKLLQELVPGCNKITGKALMLDEIINYVQSLQHQVEFLSMKLATVNPEFSVDVGQVSFKNTFTFGIEPGSSLPHSSPGFSHGNLHEMIGTNTPLHPLLNNVWNGELESILQMGLKLDQSAQTGSQDYSYRVSTKSGMN